MNLQADVSGLVISRCMQRELQAIVVLPGQVVAGIVTWQAVVNLNSDRSRLHCDCCLHWWLQVVACTATSLAVGAMPFARSLLAS